MVAVAQLVRADDCGSSGRGFEPRQPPHFLCWNTNPLLGASRARPEAQALGSPGKVAVPSPAG